MKKLTIVILICFMWIISIILTKINPMIINGTSQIIKDDFILNFNSIFLGIAVAIIALLYSNVEKIRDSINKMNIEKETITNLNSKITEIFTELKQDTLSIFYCLVTSFFLIILRDANIPFIHLNFKYFNKIELFYSLEILTVLIVFLALFDIITALFTLSKISDESIIK